MTTILIRKTGTGVYRGFTCSGHAGYAQYGEDIVCAAVSALTINTVNAMEALAGQKLQTVTGEEDGVLDVRLVGEGNEKSKLLMDAMVLGLESIAAQYGKKYLKLKFEEV